MCGNAYRKGFFKDLKQLSNPPQECWTVDDVWIAGFLEQNHIPRVQMDTKNSQNNKLETRG